MPRKCEFNLNLILTKILPRHRCDDVTVDDQFSLREEKRRSEEKGKLLAKHQNQQRERQAKCASHMRELRQLQNEKRRLLVERETEKIKNLHDDFQLEIGKWRDNLRPRKQVRTYAAL